MDERQQDDNELSNRLITGIKEVGGNIGLLSQADHTGDERRKIATDDVLEAAKASLLDLLEFVKKDTRVETAASRENALEVIEQTLGGFEYRKSHKLSGLKTQFLEARRGNWFPVKDPLPLMSW